MKTSKWLAIGVTGLLGASAQLHAEGSDTSAYFCIAEASGGVAYNAHMKKWVGMTFNPDDKFVLRLRQISRRSEKNALGNNVVVTDYNISLMNSGSNTVRTCRKHRLCQLHHHRLWRRRLPLRGRDDRLRFQHHDKSFFSF